MTETTVASHRLEPQPMPAEIGSIQPGGGHVVSLELWWGRVRRALLRRFRPGYVRRMQQRRRGHCAGCEHDVIDPRDLKFYRNVCGYSFAPEDDDFAWRDRFPLARDAWAEILLFGGPLLLAGIGFASQGWWYPTAAIVTIAVAAAAFFRDPPRTIPNEPGLLVSPADGKVVDIEQVAEHASIEGPAVKISIFLSLLNVHINRAPLAARVIALDYRPGKFYSATGQRAAQENERMEIVLEEEAFPHRRIVARQIAGAVARRIVCSLRPGQRVDRGEKFGLIKFGSRTEVILPREEGLELLVKTGTRVRAGTTPLARYRTEENIE